MRRSAAVVACALAFVAPDATAHVGASPDRDNRYLKLSLLGDRVRLAYTWYVGDRPGALERRRLDRDRDGRLADAEVAAYRRAFAERIAHALEVRIDGRVVPTAWSRIDLGLGSPVVDGGSYSIDLIAWYCLPSGPRHTIVVRDRQVMTHSGETELRVEDAPDLRVEHATVGEALLQNGATRWDAAGGALDSAGLAVAFTAGPRAPRPRQACVDGATPRATSHRATAILVAIAVAAIAGGALLVRRRRRRSQQGLSGR